VFWHFPEHTEFCGRVILGPMIETDLATVRVLLTHVKHIDIHSS